MDAADQVLHLAVLVGILHRLLERAVRAIRLADAHVEPRELRPGGAVLRVELRHRAEGADRRPGLLQLERDEADEKMAFGEVRLRAEDAATALGGFGVAARREKREAIAKSLRDPVRRSGPCRPVGLGAGHYDFDCRGLSERDRPRV